MEIQDRYAACLSGGAMGDALGYPVEFMSKNEIISKFGDNGITELAIDRTSGKALISDDTQMTLFTADGLIWSHLRCTERGIGSYEGSGTLQSYYRWYYTQTGTICDDYWLKKQPHETDNDIITYHKTILEYPELFARRAPGNSCLSALAKDRMGTVEIPVNNSKGCGGVMRVAPVGFFLHKNVEEAMVHGMGIAALTHGHPTGYVAAGAFAAIIAELVKGKSLPESLETTFLLLKGYDKNQETTLALKRAVESANSDMDTSKAISQLGEGWVAEEALAVAVYCALKEKDFKKALQMAVNHDGDSDSTGAICGNILGAEGGMEVIPHSWLPQVELKELILDMGQKLYLVNDYFGMLQDNCQE